MLLKQAPRRANNFPAHHGVIDDPAGLAADEGHIGDIEAADLEDARNDLVESVIVVQFGYTQRRRMNAVEVVLLVQKLESLHVPSDMACVRHDLEVGHGSDKPPFLFLEIFCV